MKSKNIKKVAGIFALLLVVTLLSSCNRGVGCPSAFSEAINLIPFVQ